MRCCFLPLFVSLIGKGGKRKFLSIFFPYTVAVSINPSGFSKHLFCFFRVIF